MKIITFILLCILLVGLLVLNLLMHHPHKDINLNGVHLKQSDYQAIKQTFEDDYADVMVCNLKSGNCITLIQIKAIN